MSVLVVGSVALDNVKTPFGEKKNILGGSAVHSAMAASFYGPVHLVGVAGKDFPPEHLDYLKSKNIDLRGLQITGGQTFHWEGYYEYDMNQAHTLDTQLNVLAAFRPTLPDSYRELECVFLANLEPEVRLDVIR